MGFSRQEYWTGLSLPPQGIFPTPELNPCLLHWQADSLPLSPPGRPTSHYTCVQICTKYNTKSEPSCKLWALADKDV